MSTKLRSGSQRSQRVRVIKIPRRIKPQRVPVTLPTFDIVVSEPEPQPQARTSMVPRFDGQFFTPYVKPFEPGVPTVTPIAAASIERPMDMWD